ncbi:bifunctional 4-hydroxy-2-oxoglutarate aldolase/2-dehydro-3-deoxy-phosphogluconate aldolase [Lederbergia galactosidilytica]|uniref:Ketohydroxyglutarate aldolase n=1 Tax=Lederbergia galactosidilytica TaxID=217031 RepID=A0A177ZUU8_9BACI|nr:bifunctional 4-hydroxy-2-oxoglutarate aldolase/2-dehydro-3-deoxy-phosphogluconate aldolase [Lederbergia galactosidilytica]MBP1915982.1 2-dehydro-3-deoxyphosphogluconate aldolase/(4S)-4-hydroxy-2-oxoglutarate aldolase [Lederbergia galactosidilytica]OAK71269.1 ketohydroxyglutarate aldolase [Lederbergia galactosidilytica]
MKKVKLLSKIADAGAVAVIRADSKEEAMKISAACIQGGIKGIEITFTTPEADKVMKDLSRQYEDDSNIVIGAGTVLDAVTARIAILAGAQFVVSPSFDTETARLCNLYQIPYMPGCMTVTEIKQALESGVDIIKLFPGSAFGPDYVKAIKAPLPQVNIMPTGGVSLENITQWLENGCVAVGIGGQLIAPAKNGEYEKITENARQYMQKIQEIRG